MVNLMSIKQTNVDQDHLKDHLLVILRIFNDFI